MFSLPFQQPVLTHKEGRTLVVLHLQFSRSHSKVRTYTNNSSTNSYECVLPIFFAGIGPHYSQPYGRIHDIVGPSPAPAGVPRSAILSFTRPRSAAIARNVLYGLKVNDTIIRLNYQQPIQAHVVRDWMSSHPKITLPLIIFLLGSLTYTVGPHSQLYPPLLTRR